MAAESFDWEQLKWMVPVGVVVAGVLWRVTRPACETLVFFLINGSPRREQAVKAALAVELDELADVGERLAKAEEMISAHADAQIAFDEALKAQGAALRDHVSQALNSLNRTLEKMDGTLGKIAAETKENGREISNLRGLWDGSERRTGRERRSE